MEMENDAINPSHYKDGFSFKPCECIDVARELPFSIGNAVKYIWRAGRKDDAVQDLDKAAWYISDERTSHRMTTQNVDAAFRVLNLVDLEGLTDIQRMKMSIIFKVIGGMLTEAVQQLEILKEELKK